VRSIAQSSTTGHGTNVIQGLAVSMEATALPVVVICVGIIASFLIGGLFGIGVAATTMLALAGMIIALDAYGPVTDRGRKFEESPGSMRTRCRITSGEGDLRESATENIPPLSFGLRVRVKRRGKSSPRSW